MFETFYVVFMVATRENPVVVKHHNTIKKLSIPISNNIKTHAQKSRIRNMEQGTINLQNNQKTMSNIVFAYQ